MELLLQQQSERIELSQVADRTGTFQFLPDLLLSLIESASLAQVQIN
jgi:hypothetical protein